MAIPSGLINEAMMLKVINTGNDSKYAKAPQKNKKRKPKFVEKILLKTPLKRMLNRVLGKATSGIYLLQNFHMK